MKTIKYLSIIFVLMVIVFSCRKPAPIEAPEPFCDQRVCSKGWGLHKVVTANDSVIIERPETSFDDPSNGIFLVFTNDFHVIGHVMSFGLDGGDFLIQEDGTFQITRLAFPELPTCCEWDDYFLLNQNYIHSYEVVDGDLILYFGSDNNKMIFL